MKGPEFSEMTDGKEGTEGVRKEGGRGEGVRRGKKAGRQAGRKA